jgi:hypothetical protein
MATFAGTSLDDIIVPTATGVDYRGGQGNDTYILTSLIPASAVINIIDTEGTNKIQLADGLSIASSIFQANATQLTLSNGATIIIQGASSFTYDVGANATAGDAAVAPNANYATFAAALGVATLPTGSAQSTGTTNFTVPVTGAVTAPTFSVTAGAAAVAEATDASFVVALTGRVAGVTYGTTVTLAATGGATAGTDFSNTLVLDAASIAAGVTLVGNVLSIPGSSSVSSVTLKSAVTADQVSPETGEGMSLTLSAPTGASAVIGTAAAAVAITDVPVTYTLTASAANVFEGAVITYTLTASANVLADTVVAFSVVPGDATAADQGTSNTNLNDFSAGAFNPSNVTMLSGTKTATFTVSSATDAKTELPENYSVKAVIGTTTVGTVITSLLDGNGSPPVSTFALTTSTDTPANTSGNDTYTGGVSVTAADNTLGLLDVINGGDGTDTLFVTVNVLAVDIAIPAASLTSIETVRIRAVDGDGTVGTDAATFAVGSSAITTVEASGNSNTKVTALNTGSAVGMVGDGTTKNGILSYAYATATADQIINISGGTLNTGVANITATASTGATKATINSTGAANAVGTIKLLSAGATVTSLTVNAATNLTATLTGADFTAASALTVSGAATSVDLGAAANFKTIDASGLSAGGLTITGGTNLTSFKGGQGNDTFTTAATYGAATAGMVAAGAGSADILVLAATTDMDVAGEAALYTGFETLRTAGSQDMTLLAGITAVQVGAVTGVLTQMNATQAAAVQVRVAATSATFTLTDSSGTSDVLNLSMGTGTTTAAATGFSGAVTMNGFETLNITTNAGPTATAGANQTSTFGAAFVADKLTSITLKGQSVTLTDAATTKAVTINASALTGNGTTGLTLGGNLVVGSTVTGSGVADAIALGTVGSTYNSGGGNDAFTAIAVTQIQSGAVYNTLNGGDGIDTLTITSAGITMIDDDFKGISNLEKIAGIHTGGAVSITTGGWYDTAFKTAGSTLELTSTTAGGGELVTFAGGTFTGAQTLTVTTAADGASAADNATIQTGTGADTITVTAASWVGAAGAAGALTVKSGAGNDAITVTTGTILAVTGAAPVSITAGTGADTINLTGINAGSGLTVTAVIAAGDSTTAAYDIITGFDAATAALFSSTLDFASVTLTTYAATAATGFTAAELTVAVSAAGLVTFAGTSAASATLAQKIAAVQSVVITNAGDSALFTHGSDAFVFNNNTSGDSLVELVGLSAATALITANATTLNAIFIA